MKRILWFRRDLRVSDNSLLTFGGEVLPIFIFDTNILDSLDINDRRITIIFNAVVKLKSDLQEIGLDLKIYYGKPIEILKHLASFGFDEVVASGDYDAYARQRDLEVSQFIHFRYLSDTYIFKPHEVLKEDKTPYLVFTPFYQKALKVLENREIFKKEIATHTLHTICYDGISGFKNSKCIQLDLEMKTLGFQKTELDQISLKSKLQSLRLKLCIYKLERDFLSLDATSNLSVELRFGTLGIRELLRFVQGLDGSADFIRQLIFRDFYAYLLFHFPRIEHENYKYSFNGIADQQKYELFCSAKTGVPIIDAAVTQLITTGKMHNRARMVAASFFTKDLLLPWQWGEKFFAKHLLDYDKASNVLSWQWSAGTGVDPQPYFRVFNPYLQAKRFDKDTFYIKQYLSQLCDIDLKNIHDEEWLLNNKILEYPRPIIRHHEASKIAIESFKHMEI
ncbi:MAG: deoxyribodipyrimidine photo-lyase [Thiovulaceae bacterium]|nr:deoxyribodipyrimidine photo-lyase [Sulfurimonadaceae bacterium]